MAHNTERSKGGKVCWIMDDCTDFTSTSDSRWLKFTDREVSRGLVNKLKTCILTFDTEEGELNGMASGFLFLDKMRPNLDRVLKQRKRKRDHKIWAIFR
jgi:hypothetical protein